MIVVWLLALVAGLAVAAFGSRRAVNAALDASRSSNIPPGIIGITVMAVGTDLPEIANSIVAALGGHGDLIVGDAAGSALTQVTLILGLLCLGATPIHADRDTVLTDRHAHDRGAARRCVDGARQPHQPAGRAGCWSLPGCSAIIVVQRRRPQPDPADRGARHEPTVR